MSQLLVDGDIVVQALILAWSSRCMLSTRIHINQPVDYDDIRFWALLQSKKSCCEWLWRSFFILLFVGLKRCKSAFKWTWVSDVNWKLRLQVLGMSSDRACFDAFVWASCFFFQCSAEFWYEKNPVVLLRCISAKSSASAKFCSSVGDATFSRQFGFAWWNFARSTMQSASRVTCEMAGSLVRLYRFIAWLVRL